MLKIVICVVNYAVITDPKIKSTMAEGVTLSVDDKIKSERTRQYDSTNSVVTFIKDAA
jgi:hypothetical protein